MFSFFGCIPSLKKSTVPQPKAQETPACPVQEMQIRELVHPTLEDPTTLVEDTRIVIPRRLLNILNPSVKEELKKFCKAHNLCIACSYPSPNNPTFLVFNGILYECPHCDSDVESL